MEKIEKDAVICGICEKPARYSVQSGFKVWKLNKEGCYLADVGDFWVEDPIGKLYCKSHAESEGVI